MDGFSDRNVDYGNLWRLLRQKSWKEANEETLLKLLEASGRIETLLKRGELSQKGTAILFQLFDTNGRLKMLEALADSDHFVESNVRILLNLLDPADREFYLSKAIETSEKLSSGQKKALCRLIDLPHAIKAHPGAQPSRQELFKAFVLGWQTDDWHLLRGDIELCPCRDLQTIDSFWSILSEGRFGFSVQGRIWVSVRGDLEAFSQIVGWRRNNTWINYDSVTFALKPKATFSIENARYGHLPFFPRVGWWHWMGGMDAIIKRFLCCSCFSYAETDTRVNDESLDDCNWFPSTAPERSQPHIAAPPYSYDAASCPYTAFHDRKGQQRDPYSQLSCPYNIQPCPCSIFSMRNQYS